MNMYEAIFVRRSVKKFIMEEIEQTLLDQIQQFANELPLLMKQANVEFLIVKQMEHENMNKKLFSVKAPYYFVVACDYGIDQWLNAGYLVEQLSLYLTARGIATGALMYMQMREEGIQGLEKLPMLALPFGFAKDFRVHEHNKFHRLPEKETVLYKTEVSPEVKLMIKAARLAPSHMNSQPWRLVVYENRIHVFCRKSVLGSDAIHPRKILDIGVMVANMLLVAEELWIDVSIERVENITNKLFKNNEYIVSVIVK